MQNTPDSLPVLPGTRLFFSGDYRIAHIMAEQTFSVVPCEKSTVGHIKIGAQGQPDTCQSFDFEVAGAGTTGPPPYCSDHKAGNRLIIAGSAAFDPVPYVVEMQIVVERGGTQKAIPGVYWSATVPGSEGETSLANACGVGATPWALTTYRENDGTTAATPRAISAASCDLTAAEKAVYLDQPATVLTVAGDTYLYINLPDFNYDPAEIQEGDVVKVKITLTKAGCGKIGPLTVTIGTFGCAATPLGGSSILCPYVHSLAAGDTFWSGLALTNTSASAVTVTLTALKADGSSATATETIDPQGVIAKALSAFTWTGTTPSEVHAYITADSTGPGLNGFAIMWDGTSTSMGYLCKP